MTERFLESCSLGSVLPSPSLGKWGDLEGAPTRGGFSFSGGRPRDVYVFNGCAGRDDEGDADPPGWFSDARG